tara:strand:+ start:650 stop:2101 length:1452 start_codon:yes stop_codon:yes gene_type:complete
MSVNSPKSIVITERLLRSWIRCRRKAWLDKYGDTKKRLWSAHKILQLDHQHRSFIELITKEPSKIIGKCEDGASFVLGLRLSGKTPSGKSIEANNPIIQKVEGKSKWGKFAYRPVITKQGHKITREHKLILSLNILLLEKLQRSEIYQAISISLIKNKLNTEYVSISANLRRQLLESIDKLTQDLESYEPPPISSNKRKCSICSWQNVCNSESLLKGNLNLVSGIGAKRIKILNELGIKNIKDLASTNPVDLKDKLAEPHKNIAAQIIKQSLAQVNNKKEKLTNLPSLPELQDCKGIFLYDIESDPDHNHDFLHGFIRLNKLGNGEWNLKKSIYQPLLTFDKKNESFIWESIKRKLDNFPDWPILHYGETESLYLYQLAKRNNSKDYELRDILNRCIDIHSRVKEKWILPINNYSLKTVANYIGFKWEQENVDGAKALLWWRQWKNSRRSCKVYSKNINKIFAYNKYDCLATWEIANWLLNEN